MLGLWELFGTEEWLVQADLLERRRTFPGWEQTTRYAQASLEIRRRFEGVELRTLFELRVIDGTRKHQVARSSFPDDVRWLGLFLSGQTGWPLRTTD
jgi:hypothetical protein